MAITQQQQLAPGAVENLHGFFQLALRFLAPLHGIDMPSQLDLQSLDTPKRGTVGAFLGTIHLTYCSGAVAIQSAKSQVGTGPAVFWTPPA